MHPDVFICSFQPHLWFFHPPLTCYCVVKKKKKVFLGNIFASYVPLVFYIFDIQYSFVKMFKSPVLLMLFFFPVNNDNY